ncbi:hypothetical protein SMIM3I_02240 [Streptococcus mitis]|uniref:Uncharacterized protein n=1 Tax=Streptococcus mitis TaxID=28037 RepID=A0A150NTA4_STRMT|nr:hypothetical protein SMIM3I_02240 [Streptococcus mitis]
MQPPKQRINILQLSIIEMSNKLWTPTNPIPNIFHPNILRDNDRIKARKCIPQRRFPTPPITPELHPDPRTDLKPCISFENIPSIFNRLPNSYTKPTSHLLCAPRPLLHPILTNYYPFPKRIPFLHKSPRPFPQQGLIKERKTSKTQTTFLFLHTNNRPFHQMGLIYQPPSSPKEVSLDLFQYGCHSNRENKKGHKINRQAK